MSVLDRKTGSPLRPSAQIEFPRTTVAADAEAPSSSVEFAKSSKRAAVFAGQSLLEVAEANGIEIPYSCLDGQCGTCATRLLSGDIQMDHEDGLDLALKAQNMSSPVSRGRKETSGGMFDLARHSVNPLKPCFRVSYGPVAPFSSVTCGVISILVALQPHSIEVLTLIANNSNCDALEPKTRKTEVLQLLNHLDAAYNLARWLTHNEYDAEDIVQDAYLRAIRHFGGFQGGEAKAWLLTIVRNRCYDCTRLKGVRERTMPFDEEFHNPRQVTLDPETSLLQKERAGLLREALAEVPLELREVLVLRELEELSYREIASIARIPMGTVMSRLSRARKRLQQALLVPANGMEDDPQDTSAAPY